MGISTVPAPGIYEVCKMDLLISFLFTFFFLSRYSMPDTISRRGDPLMSSLLISWSSQSSEEHARNKIRGKIQRMYNMVKSSGGKDEDGTQST